MLIGAAAGLGGAIRSRAWGDVPLPSFSRNPRLVPVAQADRVWNGVATTADGRIFVSFPSCDRPGVQVAEILPGDVIWPFPDAAWNAVRADHDPRGAFVLVNAVRIGPDGHLWVIDAGAPGIGRPAVPGGARLFVFDLARNQLVRTYDLSAGIRPRSYIDDIRFNGSHLYATDAGRAGLLVVNLASGQVRRVLDGHPLLTARRDMFADGRRLLNDQGEPLRVDGDQLEVTPDGRWLLAQPCSGPMVRIPTVLLDDPSTAPATLAQALHVWLDTPTTGGTAIDARGALYLSDTNRRRILRIGQDRRIEPLVADSRLVWSDAMWLDRTGWLWIPATQQNLTHGFQGGRQSVQYPVWLFKIHVGVGPPSNDHA
ncbi:hypothetical protein HLH28_17855 [Gluconacetobacter tumulisoli]|uniref:Gluconolactonase n=1 Tax=Gluconacetobacter tumulisoli TaxID=1286189 RepID=A0A7W4KAP9_9PROT|nr:L-dopachrome tautomerase-related protein [Gluconacetobacter tumulisoli]MBB2203402.1 hypothetical protein [Gluconacetobacter tumulisoli]